jgi:hypothetical protein
MYQGIRPMRRQAAVLAMAAAVAGCDSGPSESGGESPGDGQRPSRAERSDAGERPVSITRTVKGCRVTLPSRKPPVPGESFNYGDRKVAVAFWRRGRLVASRVPDGSTWGVVAPDGTIAAKVGWWRGVPGGLTVQGERLDAPAAPLRARVPAGYGIRGFQSTELRFPTPGCWRVVGSVAGHEIEFVVLVTIRPRDQM